MLWEKQASLDIKSTTDWQDWLIERHRLLDSICFCWCWHQELDGASLVVAACFLLWRLQFPLSTLVTPFFSSALLCSPVVSHLVSSLVSVRLKSRVKHHLPKGIGYISKSSEEEEHHSALLLPRYTDIRGGHQQKDEKERVYDARRKECTFLSPLFLPHASFSLCISWKSSLILPVFASLVMSQCLYMFVSLFLMPLMSPFLSSLMFFCCSLFFPVGVSLFDASSSRSKGETHEEIEYKKDNNNIPVCNECRSKGLSFSSPSLFSLSLSFLVWVSVWMFLRPPPGHSSPADSFLYRETQIDKHRETHYYCNTMIDTHTFDTSCFSLPFPVLLFFLEKKGRLCVYFILSLLSSWHEKSSCLACPPSPPLCVSVSWYV